MKKQLEEIAMQILNNSEKKPNYSNRDFMNAVLIFQSALMDKMFDFSQENKMTEEEQLFLANKSGLEIRGFILRYTGLDTHKVGDFI